MTGTLQLDALIAFTCGLIIIYIMFRIMGLLLLLVCLLFLSPSLRAQDVNVTNTPSVNVVSVSPDVSSSCAEGVAFAFVVSFFGIVVRMARKTTDA